jgi:hypothetical protein
LLLLFAADNPDADAGKGIGADSVDDDAGASSEGDASSGPDTEVEAILLLP